MRYKRQEGFHIALFGEPHIAIRVIITVLFVERVVASWTIRTGNNDTDFFLEVIFARNIHAHSTNDHYPTFFASNGAAHLNNSVAGGARANQHPIYTVSGGKRMTNVFNIATGWHSYGTIAFGSRYECRVEVSANNVAAVGFEQLHNDLP
ncbi:hypothetical protein D3C73_1283730 [compost metagenome]